MDEAFAKRLRSTAGSPCIIDTCSAKATIAGEIISRSAKRLRIRVDEAAAKELCCLEKQVIDRLREKGCTLFGDFDSNTVDEMWTSACSLTATDGFVMNLIPDPVAKSVATGGSFTMHVSGIVIRKNINTIWTIEARDGGADKLATELGNVEKEMQGIRDIHVAGDLDTVSDWLRMHGFST
jgi:hypothetical protein